MEKCFYLFLKIAEISYILILYRKLYLTEKAEKETVCVCVLNNFPFQIIIIYIITDNNKVYKGRKF